MENEKLQVRDLRNGDWFWANKLVLENPYLTTGAKLVYCALTFFADNKTQKSYPSIDRLSKLTSLNKSTVIRVLKKLEDYFFIKVDKKKGKISHYTLLKLTDSKPVAKSNQWQTSGKMSQRGNGVVAKKETNNTHLTILNNNNGVSNKSSNDERPNDPAGLKRIDELKRRYPFKRI